MTYCPETDTRSNCISRLWLNVDSGANVFAFRDKWWLLYFKPKRLPYKDVTGQ